MMSPAPVPNKRSAMMSISVPFTGPARHRQDVQIERVQEEVDGDDRQGAEAKGKRQIAAGLANLFGKVRGGIPARIGEHHRDERQQPRPANTGPAVCPVHGSSSKAEPQRNEDHERANLEHRQDVPDETAGTNSTPVDQPSAIAAIGPDDRFADTTSDTNPRGSVTIGVSSRHAGMKRPT